MAYVNVKDWSVDQVTDWLKGLDSVILQYNSSFLNNGVTGHQLLNLRADDLEHLGVRMLGHQEIILEAVEQLRNFHFELDKENLQTLALRLSCAANSLFKELLLVDDDCCVLQTHVISDVHNIIAAIKPLVYWLDRSPFAGDKDYIDNKTNLLQLGFEMATSAHRGIFSEKLVYTIRNNCEKLTNIADHIIQDMVDPMILQPASLDLATLKKKEQELGFFILPHNHAVHQIADIKHGSPAHLNSKIEEGDEIVQVNYQTVVGWQRKKVMLLLQESPPEIVLTLQKRPRHTKVYGQIYMKPYRLPSRKRSNESWSSRWNDSIPSPRLLPIIDLPPIRISKADESDEIPDPDLEIELSSSESEPDSPLDFSRRMYPLKPRPILKRRNTITGATPTNKRPYPSIGEYWDFIKSRTNTTHASTCNISSNKFEDDSQFLRDKSASCNVGLDMTPRPTTVIGLQSNTLSRKKKVKDDLVQKKVNFKDITHDKPCQELTTNLSEEKSVSVNSLQSLNNVNISFIDEGRELTDRSSMLSNLPKDLSTEILDTENVKTIINTLGDKKDIVVKKDPIICEIKVHDIIKKFDGHGQNNLCKQVEMKKPFLKKPVEIPMKSEGAVTRLLTDRKATRKTLGQLDKSHSTPAYDLMDDSDVPSMPLTSITNDNNSKDFVYDIKPKDSSACLIKSKEVMCNIKSKEVMCNIKSKENVCSYKSKETVSNSKNNLSQSFFEAINPFALPSKLEIKEDTIPPLETENKLLEEKKKKNIMNEDRITKSSLSQAVSTPTRSQKENSEIIINSRSYSPKSTNTDLKISPTNSIVKAMISKSKSTKKKHSIASKRRKVAVSDLSPADIQGPLYQRLRGKHNQNIHWDKRWFVLKDNCLYGFRTKDDTKAVCLIFLSGFTVAVANEVKSKLNAFKVYHTGTVFYFSAENTDTLQQWIDHIRSACLHTENTDEPNRSLYSETEDSDNERPPPPSQCKSDSFKKFGSLKKMSLKRSPEITETGSSSLDRKWFFNKSCGPSKNPMPIPTAHFRSYRKMKPDIPSTSVVTGNFTSHVFFFSPQNTTHQNISVPNLNIAPPKQNQEKKSKSKLDYMHASNPSLFNCEIKTMPPPIRNPPKLQDNISGLVTLEELMIKRSEEQKKNPHHIVEMAKASKSADLSEEIDRRPTYSPEIKVSTAVNSDSKKKHSTSRSAKTSVSSRQKIVNTSENFQGISTYPKNIKSVEKKDYRSLPRENKVSNKLAYCWSKETDSANETLDDMMYYYSERKKSNPIQKQLSFNSSDSKSKHDDKCASYVIENNEI